MTSPPASPIRGRWLIVATLLVVLATVLWWHWPRGDARFVGKWTVSSVDNSSVEPSVSFRSTIILYVNGRGEHFDHKDQRVGEFSWTVQNDRYVVGSPTTSLAVNRVIDRFQRWLPRSMRVRVSVGPDTRIDSVTREVIKLSSVNYPATTTMTRLPE